MFDTLLEESGGFGLYQKFLTFGFLLLSMSVVSTCSWNQIFILMVPPHRCKISTNDTNWFINSTILSPISECYFNTTLTSSNTSDVINESFYTTEECTHGWVYDNSEMFPTFASENDLVCGNSWRRYSIHSYYYAGALLGGVMAGWLSDKYGRKRTFQVCVLICLIFDGITLIAPSMQIFALARFCNGVGVSNVASIAFVLVIEYTLPQYRTYVLGVFSLGFTACACVLPWVAYALPHWHYMPMIAMIPSAISIFISRYVPESASWLMANGKWSETADLIHHVSRINKKTLTLDYIKSQLEQMKSQQHNDENGNAEPAVKKHYLLQSVLDLFGSPRIRKAFIIQSIIRMAASVCYMGNNLEAANLPYPWYLSFFIGSVVELPAIVLNLLLMDRLGRRWTNLLFFSVSGVIAVIASRIGIDANLIVAVSMVMRLCYSGSMDVSFTFSSESFPTVIRGRSTSLVRAFGALANIFMPFIVYLSERDKLLPFLVLGLISLVGGILNLFLPETAGQHLPHTLEEGERFGKNQPFCLCPFLAKRVKNPSSKTGGNEVKENGNTVD